jgi:hypothetical protein
MEQDSAFNDREVTIRVVLDDQSISQAVHRNNRHAKIGRQKCLDANKHDIEGAPR